MHMCIGSTHMHVHAPQQLGTFVVAWPRIRQCLLCSGGPVHLHRFMHTHSHTHKHSHGFPGLERGWIGIWAMQAFWILSVRNRPSPLNHTSQGAHSLPLRHTAITRNIQIYIFGQWAQVWPQQTLTTAVLSPHAGSCAHTLQTHSPLYFPDLHLLHPSSLQDLVSWLLSTFF